MAGAAINQPMNIVSPITRAWHTDAPTENQICNRLVFRERGEAALLDSGASRWM